VKAQVTANIDFSQVEQTAESYKPNQRPNTAAVRSTQSLETLNGVANTGGVPGALSNQPPANATMPVANAANAPGAAAAANNAANTRKEATSNNRSHYPAHQVTCWQYPSPVCCRGDE
jgi:flagellar M-ring protein FliF